MGSHKLNSAIPQAYYCKQEGVTNVTTETGAGQWGASLAYAARLFGLEAAVYQVKISYEQKPYRPIIRVHWVQPFPKLSSLPVPLRTVNIPSALYLAMLHFIKQSSDWKPKNRWRWQENIPIW